MFEERNFFNQFVRHETAKAQGNLLGSRAMSEEKSFCPCSYSDEYPIVSKLLHGEGNRVYPDSLF